MEGILPEESNLSQFVEAIRNKDPEPTRTRAPREYWSGHAADMHLSDKELRRVDVLAHCAKPSTDDPSRLQFAFPIDFLAHMRRWRRADQGILPIVHYHGEAIGRLEKSFRSARGAAGLSDDVIPHALRHTCITWLMRSGKEINEVSSFTGVSVEELRRTYRYHSPDFREGVAKAKMAKTPSKRANSRAKAAKAI